MRTFPLLPDSEGLEDLIKSLRDRGWHESLDVSATLAALVADGVILVNEGQTSKITFMDERNLVGLRLEHLALEEGDKDRTILEVHDASVDRLYAILDVCGILQVSTEWLTWFREAHWGAPVDSNVVAGELVSSGVANAERRDGFDEGNTSLQ